MSIIEAPMCVAPAPMELAAVAFADQFTLVMP
jgi:hypothetical protein